ncbi:MAG: hypothetical protein CVV64_20380 [Candidatus Wallbacteria bacterium HGW-Wallbacteria-1]|uniref:Uncharacterized protein n=1 Tax=Candidatus Wallbacteria bacterium HGW-Wallbacteria-1 TaxID=2013854 RepID=A0A2N1PIF0_9BACT|nr:MAG: hypothetical protein CVV64_20380 [Candidatus Wallbacteria bacterium HGW-Wallbacteria-1]
MAESTGVIPDLPKIDITEPNRFLNDLMLSPFWKVEKGQDGSFIARARSIYENWPSRNRGMFLFEFATDPHAEISKDYQIHNRYLESTSSDFNKRIFSSFSMMVVFQNPQVTLGKSGQKATIPVYESFENKIGLNSSSDLAFKLSSQQEIYVVLQEQGSDPERKTTFSEILPLMKELAGLANSPKTYQVEERYATFFKTFFSLPLKDNEIKRYPGLQDRDTFYGYFRVKPDTGYDGINIKISHPVYCPGEGTGKHSRLRKAEYLGKPHNAGDVLFFLIEDNAVYLPDEYDQRFGTFSGKESFEGDLEVLNDQEKVLLKVKAQFKGWER